MRNVVTVARRELHGYFNSPIAYIVVVSFLLVAGWMFFSALFLFGRADMRPFFAPSPFSPSMLLLLSLFSAAIEQVKTGTAVAARARRGAALKGLGEGGRAGRWSFVRLRE